MSLLSSFRQTWKPRHNHFVRHTDVKPKDEKRMTVNEIANQKLAMQRVNGWKVGHSFCIIMFSLQLPQWGDNVKKTFTSCPSFSCLPTPFLTLSSSFLHLPSFALYLCLVLVVLEVENYFLCFFTVSLLNTTCERKLINGISLTDCSPLWPSG